VVGGAAAVQPPPYQGTPLSLGLHGFTAGHVALRTDGQKQQATEDYRCSFFLLLHPCSRNCTSPPDRAVSMRTRCHLREGRRREKSVFRPTVGPPRHGPMGVDKRQTYAPVGARAAGHLLELSDAWELRPRVPDHSRSTARQRWRPVRIIHDHGHCHAAERRR